MNVLSVAGACARKKLHVRSVVPFTPWIARIAESRGGESYFFVLESLLARFYSIILMPAYGGSHLLIAYLAHPSLQHNLERAHDRKVRAVQDTSLSYRRAPYGDHESRVVRVASGERVTTAVVRDLKLDPLSSTCGETESVVIFAW